MQKVNVHDKLSLFSDHWNPRIVAELNGQHVKLARLKGEFIWHQHEEEDELFYVLQGQLEMAFRDRTEVIEENEFIVVPKGVEHKPIAREEVVVMLFEPATTLNTGNEINDLTKDDLERL